MTDEKLPYYEKVANTLAKVADDLLNTTPEIDAVVCVPVYKVPNSQLAPAVIRFSDPNAAQATSTNLRAAMQTCDAMLVLATRTRQILKAFDTAAAQLADDINGKRLQLEELERKIHAASNSEDVGRGSGGETPAQS